MENTQNAVEVNAKETQYVVMVPTKEAGHIEKTLGLEQTIDYLFELFKNNRMWITINATLFHPEATFSGSEKDNRIVVTDRERLRRLILDNTQKVEGQATVVPEIAAIGRPVGGARPTTYLSASLRQQLNKEARRARAKHLSIPATLSSYLLAQGVSSYEVPNLVARYTAKNR